MSRVFDKIQTNLIYLDNTNTVYLYNNNGQLAATGPNGSIVTNFTGPTGPTGSTGSQGPPQLYNVESITGSQVVDPNVRITMIAGGTTHSLTTSGVTGGTLKYIVDDSYRDISAFNYIANYSITGNNLYTFGTSINSSVYSLGIDSQNNVYASGIFSNFNRIAKWIPSGVNTGLWYAVGPGSNSGINTLAIDSKDNVYFGFIGTIIGITGTNRVAKWIPSGVNTGLWFPLGDGVNNVVNAIAIDSQDNVYVGGSFTTAGGISASRIAKWVPSGVDTGLWFSLGAGVDAEVLSLVVDPQDNLYVGGRFSTAGGINVRYIAKWIPSGLNNGIWCPLSEGFSVNSVVYSLQIDSQDNLYVGGSISSIFGNIVIVNNIAKWVPSGVNTGLWYSLGVGTNNIIYSLTLDQQDNLYVGGQFTTAGGISANRIAKWVPSGVNTGLWFPINFTENQNGLNSTVNALYYSSTGFYNNNLLIGGSFTALSTYTTSITSRFANPLSAGQGISYNLTTASSTLQGRSLEVIYNKELNSWVIVNSNFNNFTITL